MTWIYLSPHLDDAVLSCGGLIWLQAQRGQHVEIWTICAGDAPPGPVSALAQELHERWQTPFQGVARRRAEDARACQRLGATYRHFNLPDCIYRWLSDGPLIRENWQIFSPINPAENHLIGEISRLIQDNLPHRARLVTPLSVGGHVDHRLVRAATEQLSRRLWYYSDYPYAARNGKDLTDAASGFERQTSRLIPDAALRAWQDAIADYTTQVSTFWGSREELDADLLKYCREDQGAALWRATNRSRSANALDSGSTSGG
jgi:LmbE family N-acetylglucosaminyl deacetylase